MKLYFNLLGSGGDGVNGAHEYVSHHEDPEEAVDDASGVEDDSDPDRPSVLEEQRQQHTLHGAGVLPGTDSLHSVDVADMGEVSLPVALHAD